MSDEENLSLDNLLHIGEKITTQSSRATNDVDIEREDITEGPVIGSDLHVNGTVYGGKFVTKRSRRKERNDEQSDAQSDEEDSVSEISSDSEDNEYNTQHEEVEGPGKRIKRTIGSQIFSFIKQHIAIILFIALAIAVALIFYYTKSFSVFSTIQTLKGDNMKWQKTVNYLTERNDFLETQLKIAQQKEEQYYSGLSRVDEREESHPRVEEVSDTNPLEIEPSEEEDT